MRTYLRFTDWLTSSSHRDPFPLFNWHTQAGRRAWLNHGVSRCDRFRSVKEDGFRLANDAAFSEEYALPAALRRGDMNKITADFAGAARRALAAGFLLIEVHAAHGYLLHEFFRPSQTLALMSTAEASKTVGASRWRSYGQCGRTFRIACLCGYGCPLRIGLSLPPTLPREDLP